MYEKNCSCNKLRRLVIIPVKLTFDGRTAIALEHKNVDVLVPSTVYHCSKSQRCVILIPPLPPSTQIHCLFSVFHSFPFFVELCMSAMLKITSMFGSVVYTI